MGTYPMMLYGAGIFINIINFYPKNNQSLQVNGASGLIKHEKTWEITYDWTF